METARPHYPKRCALWYVKEAHCIAETVSWSRGLCPAHFCDMLVTYGRSWVEKVPVGYTIRATGQAIHLPKEVYERAAKIQKERRLLPPWKKQRYVYAP